jgi:hypothetical protein
MAKYEVIAKGIFVKDKDGRMRELEIGDVIDESTPHIESKLRKVNEKMLEVATPQESQPKAKKTK